MAQRIAFIGLGIMGSRMAANLRRAGFELVVWNRTRATAERWCELHGGRVADTPADAAAAADVVVTMVVDGDQVRSVLLGPAGAGERATAEALCVDMSTIGPAAAREIGGDLVGLGLRFVDAPVTGSSPRAEDGTLTIMAGGEREDFERAVPLFEAMGELVVHVGPLGHGQMVKLINNAVAAINATAVGEALLLGVRAGLDLDVLVQVMAAGAGASAMLDLKAAPMRAHDYTTLFKLDHMLKDLRLCLQEADAVGGGMTLVEHVRELLQAGADAGCGDQDFAALVEVLEQRAGARLSATSAPGVRQRAAPRAADEVHDQRRERHRQ